MCKKMLATKRIGGSTVDEVEVQLVNNLTYAKLELNNYRKERLIRLSIEKQVAEAAIAEFRLKQQSSPDANQVL
jgi:hypothetical protein